MNNLSGLFHDKRIRGFLLNRQNLIEEEGRCRSCRTRRSDSVGTDIGPAIRGNDRCNIAVIYAPCSDAGKRRGLSRVR